MQYKYNIRVNKTKYKITVKHLLQGICKSKINIFQTLLFKL